MLFEILYFVLGWAPICAIALFCFAPRLLAWSAVIPLGPPKRISLELRERALIQIPEGERLLLQRIGESHLRGDEYVGWIRPAQHEVVIRPRWPIHLRSGLACIALREGDELVATTKQSAFVISFLPMLLLLAIRDRSVVPSLAGAIVILLTVGLTRASLERARDECLSQLETSIRKLGGSAPQRTNEVSTKSST